MTLCAICNHHGWQDLHRSIAGVEVRCGCACHWKHPKRASHMRKQRRRWFLALLCFAAGAASFWLVHSLAVLVCATTLLLVDTVRSLPFL